MASSLNRLDDPRLTKLSTALTARTPASKSPATRECMLRSAFKIVSDRTAALALLRVRKCHHCGMRQITQPLAVMRTRVVHDLLAHARFPKTLQVMADAFDRNFAIWFGREEIGNVVGHCH